MLGGQDKAGKGSQQDKRRQELSWSLHMSGGSPEELAEVPDLGLVSSQAGQADVEDHVAESRIRQHGHMAQQFMAQVRLWGVFRVGGMPDELQHSSSLTE